MHNNISSAYLFPISLSIVCFLFIFYLYLFAKQRRKYILKCLDGDKKLDDSCSVTSHASSNTNTSNKRDQEQQTEESAIMMHRRGVEKSSRPVSQKFNSNRMPYRPLTHNVNRSIITKSAKIIKPP